MINPFKTLIAGSIIFIATGLFANNNMANMSLPHGDCDSVAARDYRACRLIPGPYLCNLADHCRWSHERRACVEAWNGMAEGLHRPCYRIDRPWRCNRTPGCRWNRYEGYCERDHGGGHHGDYCRHIYNPRECENRGCEWSRDDGCVGRW